MEQAFDSRKPKAALEPLANVYLLHGGDDVEQQRFVDIVRQTVTDESFADFDTETLDATDASAEQIIGAAGLAPFGSERRLVVVRSGEALRRKDRQRDTESITAAIGTIGGATCLVIKVAPDPSRGRARTVINPKFDAAVRQHGCIVEFRTLGTDDLADWVVAEVAAQGKKIGRQAANVLVTAAHGDRTALRHEIDKAVLFVGPLDRISPQDVAMVASRDAEDVIFDLVDAVGSRQAGRALNLLHEALRYDTRPQSVAGRMLALLGRQLKLLWQASELSSRHIDPSAVRRLPETIAEDLPTEASITSVAWKARDLFAMARKWDAQSLACAFDMLLECDLANKGGTEGSGDVVGNLETLVVRLCQTA